MTKLLEEAIEAIKAMPPADQDAFARWLLAQAKSSRSDLDADLATRIVGRMKAATKTLPSDYQFNRQELYEERNVG